ncbi:MAG: hypothetical protein EXQ48_06220 [Acidobacteria bacterium]|nr:hypothetical protein [Acidobacteriota bacterium]
MSIRVQFARSGALVLLLAAATVAASAQGRGAAGQGRGGGPPATPRAAALADLTGTWVALVTEDWRYRMFTPPKGDYVSLPLNPAGRKAADAWDPARDEAAGEQCKAYGAAGLMRMPMRVRISWQDDTTLKLETDAGTQTRLLGFGPAQGQAGSWQGVSTASWDYPRAIIGGRGAPGPPPGGALKVVTTQMRPGYLRRNGVPYSANAVMTEYFNRLDVPGGDALLVVVAEIVDPEYLATPYWTSTQFKHQNDASGWNPTSCAAR